MKSFGCTFPPFLSTLTVFSLKPHVYLRLKAVSTALSMQKDADSRFERTSAFLAQSKPRWVWEGVVSVFSSINCNIF